MTPPTVASFPADHPYIEAVRPAGWRPATLDATDRGTWTPHPWWEPEVLTRHAGAVDLLHVHFGYDHLSVPQLHDWTAAVAQLGRPLVVTIHDLRNPHHDRPELHDAHLTALLAAAHEVLTLTPGAAAVIADRWGRGARVVAHPGLVTPAPRPPRPIGGPLVGVHLKSLRRNLVEPDRVVAAVVAGAQAAGGTVAVDVHRDAADRAELAGTRRLAAAGSVDLRIHERFSDRSLLDYLEALDVSVMPHRFGTHSGWLEVCRDVGTRVVAPNCGFYSEQWAEIHSYGNSEARGLDADSLSHAVSRALLAPRLAPACPAARSATRDVVRRAHAEVYRRATEAACAPIR